MNSEVTRELARQAGRGIGALQACALQAKRDGRAAVSEQLSDIAASLERAALAFAKQTDAAPSLLAACQEALEFAEDQEDVVDGSEGEQRPNSAMLLAQTLRAALAKAGAAS